MEAHAHLTTPYPSEQSRFTNDCEIRPDNSVRLTKIAHVLCIGEATPSNQVANIQFLFSKSKVSALELYTVFSVQRDN